MVWGDAGWGGDGPAGLPEFAGAQHVGAVFSTNFVVSWNAGADVATEPADLVYEVHASRSAGAPFEVRAASAPGALGALVNDLIPDTTYYVRVRCRNLQGITSRDLGPELTVRTASDPAPVLTGLSPAAGAPLAPTAAVAFDVTDVSGLRRVYVFARLSGGAKEVVHNGSAFEPAYEVGSARTAISNGYHYVLRRYGGWPAGSASFEVHAIDRTGAET